jgi:hypothetical protein
MVFICLIEASGGPGKYWLVHGRLLANNLFNLNFIFLSNSTPARQNEQQFLRMYSASNGLFCGNGLT